MDEKHKKLGFRALFLLLVTAAFVFGIGAGATMYATGKEVVSNPKMQMVSHTEYRFAEAGQIIARIVDFQGDPVVVTSCNATILYPDKTSFVSAQGMTASGIGGDYYYNFTTPAAGPEGVYEYQATCYYGVNKNASVTNSFHLSSAFNTISGNLTLAREQLTNLSTQVGAVNASLGAQIAGLSTQLNNNITTVLQTLSDVNSTLYQAILNVSSSTNLTPVLNAIYDLNTSMNAQFSELDGSLTGNFSIVNTKLDYLNVTATDTYAALLQVNTTTMNTYTYVTTTLATDIDDILGQLGILNATLNRVETLSTVINSTTTQILDNQQNAVQMDTFSG